MDCGLDLLFLTGYYNINWLLLWTKLAFWFPFVTTNVTICIIQIFNSCSKVYFVCLSHIWQLFATKQKFCINLTFSQLRIHVPNRILFLLIQEKKFPLKKLLRKSFKKTCSAILIFKKEQFQFKVRKKS